MVTNKTKVEVDNIWRFIRHFETIFKEIILNINQNFVASLTGWQFIIKALARPYQISRQSKSQTLFISGKYVFFLI